MRRSEAHELSIRNENQRRVLSSFDQPQTAKQLARRTGLSFDSCRDVVRKLRAKGLITCLNAHALRSRVYWPTSLGRECLKQIGTDQASATVATNPPDVAWNDYGWVCFSHRAAVIRALTEPLQPSAIKRRARSQNANLRMSANNVRDIIKLFLQRGVVQPVSVRKRAHPRYELTEIGQKLRQLLHNAEVSA